MSPIYVKGPGLNDLVFYRHGRDVESFVINPIPLANIRSWRKVELKDCPTFP